VGNQIGKVAIVRENEQAFAVHVEASDRVELNVADWYEVQHGLPALLIAGSSHEAGRLVKDEVAVAALEHGDAIDHDLVNIGVGASAEGGLHDAVHRHPALEDHLFGNAAGCDSGVGKDLLEAFRRHAEFRVARPEFEVRGASLKKPRSHSEG
jgi:hypothetical protein